MMLSAARAVSGGLSGSSLAVSLIWYFPSGRRRVSHAYDPFFSVLFSITFHDFSSSPLKCIVNCRESLFGSSTSQWIFFCAIWWCGFESAGVWGFVSVLPSAFASAGFCNEEGSFSIVKLTTLGGWFFGKYDNDTLFIAGVVPVFVVCRTALYCIKRAGALVILSPDNR